MTAPIDPFETGLDGTRPAQVARASILDDALLLSDVTPDTATLLISERLGIETRPMAGCEMLRGSSARAVRRSDVP